MDEQRIQLSNEDIREGLRLWNELQHAHDTYHVAENDWTRFIGQMGALYGVPAGWQLTDLLRGFEPQKAKEHG